MKEQNTKMENAGLEKNAKVEKAVPENKRTENARAEDAGRGKCLHCWVICSDLQRTL